MSEPMSLGHALPLEMARVRDEILPVYVSLGLPGIFAAANMRLWLDLAARALAKQDIAEMMMAYQELKGFQL